MEPITICTIVTTSLIVLFFVYHVQGPLADKMREKYFKHCKDCSLDTCLIPIGGFVVNIKPYISKYTKCYGVAIDGKLYDIPKGIWGLEVPNTFQCLVNSRASGGSFSSITVYYDTANRKAVEAFLDCH